LPQRGMPSAEPVPSELDRYEFHNGNSNKFWIIQQRGTAVATWYGRCGKPPRGGVFKAKKGWTSEEQAGNFVQSQRKSKTKEGYKVVGKGYNLGKYDKDGLPTEGEPPPRKMKVINKFIPFSKFKKDNAEGVSSIKAAAIKFGKAYLKNECDAEAGLAAIPQGLRQDIQTINADNCDKVSEAIKLQLEVLRQQKFFDHEHIKPLKESFWDQDDDWNCVQVQEFVAAEGFELAHWTGKQGGNCYHWLLLKTDGTYVMIANGNDNFLEWGGTGLEEEDTYNDEIDADEEEASERWLNKFLIIKYPDDCDMYMEDDEDFEEIMEDM